MQLVVMLSAQRNHKQVVCLCTHSTLPVANQVVGVVSLLVTADARLGLNPCLGLGSMCLRSEGMATLISLLNTSRFQP